MIKIFVMILLLSLKTYAAELTIDVLDLGKNETQIIVTDTCQEKFILVIDNNELKTDKASKWLKFLYESQSIDQCLDKKVDAL